MKKLSKIVSLLLITGLIAGCAAKEPQISSDDTSINLEETLQQPVVGAPIGNAVAALAQHPFQGIASTHQGAGRLYCSNFLFSA